MIIQICVGSSCHIKGSAEIVELLQAAVAENHLENDITLAGSFCIGKCNRVGVTIQVDEEVHTGGGVSKPAINPNAGKNKEKVTFTDVAEDAWYVDAVSWAVEQGITSGTSETTFSPDASCTRAQTVTFLSRV